MKCVAFAFVGLLSLPAPLRSEEMHKIPLDKIWAWQMPGTLDVATLEKDKPPSFAYGPLVRDILRVLGDAPEEGKPAREAFAVQGTGLDALREAHAVLVQKKKPQNTFPAGSEISVVFFSYSSGSYVHLEKVQRRDNVIEIRYRFVPHKTAELTEHIAIAPLGPSPAGEFQVAVIQSPMDERFVKGGFRPVDPAVARQLVSGSFRFSVEEAR
jgi:hypothetical protein